MPIFEVETPDGTFEVDAPDEASALAALAPQATAPTPVTPSQNAAAQEFSDFASTATQNPAYGQYTQLPEWQKPIVAAGDIASSMADAATFGLGDKLAAHGRSAMYGSDYDTELAEMRRQTEGSRQRSGWAGTASEVLGMGGVMKKAGDKGLRLAGRFGSDAVTGLKGIALRSGLMGTEGAAYGAASAAGHDQDAVAGAGLGFAAGGLGNLAGEAISTGVSKLAGLLNKKPAAPLSMEKLNDNKKAAYDLSEKAGVIIKPAGMKSLADRAKADLADFGYDPSLHPGAAAVLRKIEETQGQNVTLKGLDVIRKTAMNAYVLGNKSNNAAVSKLVGHIDDLIDSGDTNLIEGLNTAVGQKAIKVAREYAKRAAKLETANNLIKRGNQQADRNITDTRVKSVKSQLQNINDPFKGWGRGFNEAEKAAAAKAAAYTPAQRALHGVSGLNPFGGGKLSAMSHIGAAAAGGFNPGLLAVQGIGVGVGMGAQKLGEHLANKSVNEFVDLVARGGVPAPVVKNALQRLSESKREAISRLLMAAGIQLAP